MYNRDLAIAELTNLIVDEFNQGALSIDDIIQNGYVGINTYTDEQIMQELTDRDVSYLFGEDE
jgi:hypothetical protein